MNTKTAFITIIGRANVGKSTLLNSVMEEKISIVSKKPQTTRNKITGILTKNDTQYVFFDTPGLHIPKSLLGSYMTKSAANAMGDVDVVVLLVEPMAKIGQIERGVLERVKADGIPLILVINKVDTVHKDIILEVIKIYSDEFEFSAIIPSAAINGLGVQEIMAEIDKYAYESPYFFPEDTLTDQSERVIVSEMIREKALRLLTDEVPHGIGISVEEFKESEDKLSIRAEIICEKDSHKKIVIGKGGEMIKKIGTYAREDLEKFFDTKIYLDLWVRVKENWRDRQNILNDLGYNEKEL